MGGIAIERYDHPALSHFGTFLPDLGKDIARASLLNSSRLRPVMTYVHQVTAHKWQLHADHWEPFSISPARFLPHDLQLIGSRDDEAVIVAVIVTAGKLLDMATMLAFHIGSEVITENKRNFLNLHPSPLPPLALAQSQAALPRRLCNHDFLGNFLLGSPILIVKRPGIGLGASVLLYQIVRQLEQKSASGAKLAEGCRGRILLGVNREKRGFDSASL